MKKTNFIKKIVSILLVLTTLVGAASMLMISASAANYTTDYKSYNALESNDFARWNGSRMIKGANTTKSEIMRIQAFLNYCIKYEGLKTSYISVDASYGPSTKQAVLAYQKAAGLTQDGSFGPSCIKKMNEVLNDGRVSFAAEYELVWPVSTSVKGIGKISSGFGPRNTGIKGASTNHRGIDVAVAKGTDIYSAADGVVTVVGSSNYRGKYVVIYHKELNISTLYQHLSSYDVKKGDTVKAGEKIADSGNTGIGSGPHLHFGVMVGKATKADHDQPGYNMAIDPCGSRITYRNYK